MEYTITRHLKTHTNTLFFEGDEIVLKSNDEAREAIGFLKSQGIKDFSINIVNIKA